MNGLARTKRPLLLGHRGARALKSIPENTVPSFDRALADGCDGFEFDVRLTADGSPIIRHDPRFRGVEIASASWRRVQTLPRLDDVLVRYQDRAFLDIELKVAGLEKKIVSLIGDVRPQCGFVVSSFLPEVLRTVRDENGEIPLGLICETHAELRYWNRLPVEYVIPHYKLADSKLIRELQGAGKEILVWTVNESSRMRHFRDLGVDGIISDNTQLLCETLGVRRDSNVG